MDQEDKLDEEFLGQYPELLHLVEECFVDVGYDHDDHSEREDGRSLMLNMSDTFGYACGDGELFTSKDIPEILKIYDEYGDVGLTCWAAKHRGYDPVVEYTEDPVYQNTWKSMYGDLKIEPTVEKGRWSERKLNLKPWVKNVRE